MKREFVINRQGKDYVLYAGLLDAAHDAGLHSIETALTQIPTPENGQTAICTALVTLADPTTGVTRCFSAVGDASPDNVGRMVANALIRMAETRAKARALRDAINVTAELLDDLAPEHDQAAPPERGHVDPPRPAASYSVREAQAQQAAADSAAPRKTPPSPATPADLDALTAAGIPTRPNLQTIGGCQGYARILWRTIKHAGLVPPAPPPAEGATLEHWRTYCTMLEAGTPAIQGAPV